MSIDAFPRMPCSKSCDSLLLFWRTVYLFPGWLKLNRGLTAIIASWEPFSWCCRIAPLGYSQIGDITQWLLHLWDSPSIAAEIPGTFCLKCFINRSLCSHGPLQCCQTAAASAWRVTAAPQLRAVLCRGLPFPLTLPHLLAMLLNNKGRGMEMWPSRKIKAILYWHWKGWVRVGVSRGVGLSSINNSWESLL